MHTVLCPAKAVYVLAMGIHGIPQFSKGCTAQCEESSSPLSHGTVSKTNISLPAPDLVLY